ncbi:MAG TPA: DUF89 family protein, partial [Thermoplasmatales archaeon]|nr:DUF89 family protein [Thermoplasmatales archaeon]
PEISREVHALIKKITGSDDPYKKVKEESNIAAGRLYPGLKEMVERADDPLLAALKLSIAGNVIDFGTSNRFDIRDMIDRMENEGMGDSYPLFKKFLDKTESVVYLGDNAGEVFFDRLLIEKLADMGKEITYVVRANPIINDATVEDAKYAGIDSIAEVIAGDEGQAISAPGTLLSRVSPEFMDRFTDADMVISKGQGNYESLSDVTRSMVFLLMVKCPLVARDIGMEVGNPVLKVKE